jgi:hypothetical protein
MRIAVQAMTRNTIASLYTGFAAIIFFYCVSEARTCRSPHTFYINIQEQEKPWALYTPHTSDKVSNLGEQKLLQYIYKITVCMGEYLQYFNKYQKRKKTIL